MEKLKFIRPTKEYEKQAFEYLEEFDKYNSEVNGVGGLYRYIDDYDGWLEKLEEDRNMVPGSVLGRVPAETFMLIREEDNRLLGIINIRLLLNEELLKRGGHIGYGVRPTERRKGYNAYQLYMALKFCLEKGLDKVLITCSKENIGSAKSIINSGGILEDEYIQDNGEVVQRYWIDLESNVKRLSRKYQ